MKKSIIVLMALSLIIVSYKLFAQTESPAKTHGCYWLQNSPTNAVVYCEQTGTMCAVPQDCVNP